MRRTAQRLAMNPLRALHHRPAGAYRAAGAHRHGLAAQRGVATLIVMMVLFFIISLVAAYTSRNLIFEQRTSANQYRSTQAFEAAEAGVEWAMARLNGARMLNNCTPIADPTAVSSPPEESFAERFLSIDSSTGVVTPVANRLAGCAFNGTGWECHCPASGEPSLSPSTTGAGPFPAFWVRFTTPVPVPVPSTPVRAGLVTVEVNACTRNDASCLRFDRRGEAGDGMATVWALLTLRSTMFTTPTAPLTTRGALAQATSSTLTVSNPDASSNGITIQSGQAVNLSPSSATLTLASSPGTPGTASVLDNDPSLMLPDLDPSVVAPPAHQGLTRMFISVFGMWPGTMAESPGNVNIACATSCSANSDLLPAIRLNPGRPLYVQGGGTLTIDADVGTSTAPVVIVADGSVQFDSSNRTVQGLVYSQSSLWTTGGNGTINGAAVAQAQMTVSGTLNLTYDKAVLERTRILIGTWLRVPGSWRDFKNG